jgi:hypothetical protein
MVMFVTYGASPRSGNGTWLTSSITDEVDRPLPDCNRMILIIVLDWSGSDGTNERAT